MSMDVELQGAEGFEDYFWWEKGTEADSLKIIMVFSSCFFLLIAFALFVTEWKYSF